MTGKASLILTIFAITFFASCKSSNDSSQKPRANCLSTNLQSGVIAFYPFSGGSLNDLSGNSYNLTNTTTASPGKDRAGNAMCAFNFVKSNNEYLKFSNPTFLNNFQNLPFSISLWYKNLTTTAPNYELLISRDSIYAVNCGDTYGQWSVGLYDFRKPVFGINQSTIWWNNFARPDTLWKHLVVTCQGTNLGMYLNGVATTENYHTGCTHPVSDAGDLFIGNVYTGLLDDIIIYNRVLTQAEITELYNLPACCQ